MEGIQGYAIFMLDPDGFVVSWNQGIENIKGYSEEEIVGKHYSVFYTEEDRLAGKPDSLLLLAQQDGVCLDEGWRVRKDGSRFWASIKIRASFNDNEKLVGFAKIARDETENRKAADEVEVLARSARVRNNGYEFYSNC